MHRDPASSLYFPQKTVPPSVARRIFFAEFVDAFMFSTVSNGLAAMTRMRTLCFSLWMPAFFALVLAFFGLSPTAVAASADSIAQASMSDEAERSSRPQNSSSFIGMGMTTGTPSGDVRAAIQPQLHTLGVPRAVLDVKVNEADLFSLPSPMELRRPIRIGIQASLGESIHAPWLAYTVAELRHAIGRDRVRILWLDDDSLLLGVQSRQLDFVMSDPDTVLRAQRGDAMETLATFRPVEAGRAEDAQAGVIFMKRTGAGASAFSQKTPLEVPIEAMRGKTIAAVVPDALAGWLAPAALLVRNGVKMEQLLRNTTFYGTNAEAVLGAVLQGEERVGFLPSCALERLEAQGKVSIARDLVIVNPVKNDKLACIHSTAVYPGWSFSTLPTTDPALKKSMNALLYSMTNDAYGGEWTLPALNRTVFDMFYELKIGPYEDLASWSFERFMRENAEGLALSVLGTFIVISYVVSLSVLVRRKTKELREALASRDLVEAEAAQSRAHIANLERTGIVGQMSTIIAHELKQPLSAIMNYANGLHRRTKAGKFDQESFNWALEEIVSEADRASEIVNRVRAYAKHDYPPRKVTDLADVISNAITTFRRSRQTKAEIIVRVSRHSMAEVDAWEIELAVLNLLKNAADAVSGVFHPQIEVALEPLDAKTWALTVADNGPYLSDEQLALFFKPLRTTKGAKGLGLGLSIIANIAERHTGRITVERTGSRGVKFTFTLPRIAEKAEPIEDLMLPPKLAVYDGSPSTAGETVSSTSPTGTNAPGEKPDRPAY